MGKYVPCMQKVQRILLLRAESLMSLCGLQFSSIYCLAKFEVIFLSERDIQDFCSEKYKRVVKDTQLNSWEVLLRG